MTENTDNQGINILRTPVELNPGDFVSHCSLIYKISEILGFGSVVAIAVESGRSKVLRVAELELITNQNHSHVTVDIDDISDEDWKTATERYSIIKPLLETPHLTKDNVRKRAEEKGFGVTTLYRWINSYRGMNVISSLIPKSRGWTKGKSRLSENADNVINEVINDTYLTVQRSTVKKVAIEVKRRCLERGIDSPHENTIRAKVAKLSEKRVLRGRGQKEKAKNKFSPTPGHFPNATYPLAVVQIDHTPLDIILVDDLYRKPIGRPWLTMAIDVYSRMVTGYYLSFDPPSGASVAMCMAHSILPKETWLSMLGVDAEWNVWGVMDKVHVDNGADFRAKNFLRSCEMYDINLEFRPIKQPQYGGHIERLLGTFLTEVHDLPGTTFSSVKHRDEYDSEKHACITKSELELWLATLVCKVYHERLHTGIGTSPSKQWEIGLMGNAEHPGRGLPARPSNQSTLIYDFLPSFKRTIQSYGVSIDGLNYYADVIRPWINAPSLDDQKKKREFIFRRDPRDISIIWFFDPDIQKYFRIPFANQSLPTMSIWEYRSAQELIKKQRGKINEHTILTAISDLREQVEASQKNTKKARRTHQRRVEHQKLATPGITKPSLENKPSENNWFDDDVSTFEDIL